MLRSKRWFVVLGILVLAFGLLFGTALADPGDPPNDAERGWGMHAQMDPEMYGQMIQRMTETHGPEFTAEMLQRMNGEGDCHGDGHEHGDGHGMMGGGMMNSLMQGTQGMMRGAARMLDGSGMMNR